jgi:hypothetical protein
MDRNKKIVFRFLFVALIIFTLACGIYFSVPLFLTKILFPRIAKDLGFSTSTCEVRKFSLSRLDLSSLQWGEPESPSLSCDSIRIDYSLPGLMKRHIRKIIMSGIEIRAEYKNGTIIIPGMDFTKLFKGSSDAEQKKTDNSLQRTLPVSFGEFALRNATIILKSGDEDFRMPLSMKAKPFVMEGNEPASRYELQVWLYLNLTNLLPGFNITSTIDMNARYDFTTNDFGIKLDLADMNIEYNGLHVQNSPGNVPLTIEVRKKQDDIHIKFSRFCMVSPVPIELSMGENTDCNLRISPEYMDMKGKIFANINKELTNSNSHFWLKLANSASLPFLFKGKKRGSQWYFSLNSTGSSSPLQFYGQTEKVSLHPKVISVYGKGKGAHGITRFAMNMSHIHYDSDDMHINIPNLLIYGNSSIGSAQIPATMAFAKVTDAECNMGSLYAGKIHAKIPFQWPYPAMELDKIKFVNEPERYCTIGEIKYADMDVGRMSAIPYQDGLNVIFSGQHTDFLPDFLVNFSGMAGISNEGSFVSKVDFKASESGNAIKIDLGKFSPQLADTFFEGNLDINGNCTSIGNTITSSGLVAMHNATIEAPEKKMILEGLDLDLSIPDLYKFRSDPEQVLKFKRFAWGDIEMNEGEVEFQIESLSSLFLKKSSFSWCGGHVYTHGLQVKPAKRELDIICYCDRLKLSTLLKQFNLARAEGEGAVNGRIPIRYKNGKIKVLDGFLYSTPGEGGTINFRTDTLVPGASGVQQSIQMQIAEEALKNFKYDWAKLSLLSEGDDLMIRMQMDGRPADLLPFGFSKEMGLVKIEQPRAHFQGIRFNINFKLPLDKMISYGSGLSGLMQNK